MAEAARRHIRGAVAEGAPRDQGAEAEVGTIGEQQLTRTQLGSTDVIGVQLHEAHATGEKLHRAPDC